MATSPLPQHMTAKEFLALPENTQEGVTLELIEGEVVATASPVPWNSIVASNIGFELRRWADKHKAGRVVTAPTDTELTEDSVLVPDTWFISKARLHIIGPKHIEGPPDLVIEVLSPSTRRRDLTAKRRIYEAARVQEYWIVDPDARSVTVLVHHQGTYREHLIATENDAIRSPLLGSHSIPLSRIFA